MKFKFFLLKIYILSDLMQLRFIGADWSNGIEPVDSSSSKKSKDNEKISFPLRSVGPSPTQVQNLFIFISKIYI